jgi:hypothetical protein
MTEEENAPDDDVSRCAVCRATFKRDGRRRITCSKACSDSYRSSKHGRHGYGNSQAYLLLRLARDRPDLLDAWERSEYRSVRAAAIAAGIIRLPDPDERALERLFAAWRAADLETRRAFVWLVEEGDCDDMPKLRPGPRPWRREETSPPEIEAALARGETIVGLATKLGVSRQTITRWRAAIAKPRRKQLEAIRRHVGDGAGAVDETVSGT